MKNISLQNKSITQERPRDYGQINADDLLKQSFLSYGTDETCPPGISNETNKGASCSCEGGCVCCRTDNVSSSFMPSVQHLLREDTKENINESSEKFGKGLNNSGDVPSSTGSTPTNNSNDPSDTIKSKISMLQKVKEEFEQSGDINALKDLFPYLKSIQDQPEKLKQYKEIVNNFITKGKFFMYDESFTKDTNFTDLKNLKEMNNFVKNLIVLSIVDLYHNRPEINSVLDRPEGLTIVTLNRHKSDSTPADNKPAETPANNNTPSETPTDKATPSEIAPAPTGTTLNEIPSSDTSQTGVMSNGSAVGMYNGKENSIYLDGTATLISILNLDDMGSTPTGSNVNKTEEYAVPQHEFTHAFDAEKGAEGYHADAVLPGMSSEDAAVIVKAFENVKKEGNNVHPYSKTNKEEFLASTIETFIDDPRALAEGSKELKELYELYKKYFDYDPIELQKLAA